MSGNNVVLSSGGNAWDSSVPRAFPRSRFTAAEWNAKSKSEKTLTEHDQKRRNRAYLRYYEANFEIENTDLNSFWKAVVLRENIPFCIPETLTPMNRWYFHMVDDERKAVRDSYKAKADALIAEGKLPHELCTTVLRRIYWEKKLARHRGVPYEGEIESENKLIESYVIDDNEAKLGHVPLVGNLQEYHVQRAMAQRRFRAVDQDISRLKDLKNYWVVQLLRERVPLCVPESDHTIESWRGERPDSELKKEYNEYYQKAMSEVRAGRLPVNLCTTEERKQFWNRMLKEHGPNAGRVPQPTETSQAPAEAAKEIVLSSSEDDVQETSSSGVKPAESVRRNAVEAYESPAQLNFALAKYKEYDQDIESTGLSRVWKLRVLREVMPFCIPESQFTVEQWRAMDYAAMLNARNKGMAEAMKYIERGVSPTHLCTTDARSNYWARILLQHKHKGKSRRTSVRRATQLAKLTSDPEFERKKDFAWQKFYSCDQDIDATGLSDLWKEIILDDFIPFSVPTSRFTKAEWHALDFVVKLEMCRECYATAMNTVKEGKIPEDLCTSELRREFWTKILHKHTSKEPSERSQRQEKSTSPVPNDTFRTLRPNSRSTTECLIEMMGESEWRAVPKADRQKLISFMRDRLQMMQTISEEENAGMFHISRKRIRSKYLPMYMPEGAYSMTRWRELDDAERVKLLDEHRRRGQAEVKSGRLPCSLCTTQERTDYWSERLAEANKAKEAGAGVGESESEPLPPGEEKPISKTKMKRQLEKMEGGPKKHKLAGILPPPTSSKGWIDILPHVPPHMRNNGTYSTQDWREMSPDSRERVANFFATEGETLAELISQFGPDQGRVKMKELKKRVVPMIPVHVPYCIPEEDYTEREWKELPKAQRATLITNYRKKEAKCLKEGKIPKICATTPERRRYWQRNLETWRKFVEDHPDVMAKEARKMKKNLEHNEILNEPIPSVSHRNSRHPSYDQHRSTGFWDHLFQSRGPPPPPLPRHLPVPPPPPSLTPFDVPPPPIQRAPPVSQMPLPAFKEDQRQLSLGEQAEAKVAKLFPELKNPLNLTREQTELRRRLIKQQVEILFDEKHGGNQYQSERRRPRPKSRSRSRSRSRSPLPVPSSALPVESDVEFLSRSTSLADRLMEGGFKATDPKFLFKDKPDVWLAKCILKGLKSAVGEVEKGGLKFPANNGDSDSDMDF